MVGISTNLIHSAESNTPDVTPPINITTTYKYPQNPQDLIPSNERLNSEYYYNNNSYVYSRINHQNSELIENLLTPILNGYPIIYNSGLSAFNAALINLNPKKIIIGQAYHGCHGIIKIWERNFGLQVLDINELSNFELLSPGDLVHLETPVNPHGTSFNIKFYADLAHAKGAKLMVDSTFAPPPLQFPFDHGADIIMHSATKYFGGHSDLLAGLIIVKTAQERLNFFNDRLLLGTIIGNLESSLLIRSLKTFELRITKQSENCIKLVTYLHTNLSNLTNLSQIYHSSLQSDPYITKQLVGGHSPTFSITMKTEELAKSLPSKLKFFFHATSLGGVESLIEWRAMSDELVDRCLLRVSVGVENIEDLILDFDQALRR